uniref:Uncharacterized protein n=1 Tax=Anguilla anguilla TaxID=7936 RepID=A0A0E9QXF6_ANGAN
MQWRRGCFIISNYLPNRYFVSCDLGYNSEYARISRCADSYHPCSY